MGRSDSRSRSRSPRDRSHRRQRSATYSRSPSLPPASKRLHISNLDESVTKADVEDAFGRYGKLTDLWITSYAPCYAFVTFEREEQATAALKAMRNGRIRDCEIRVSIALPRNKYGRGGGGGGGGDRRDYAPSRRYNSRRSRSPRRRSRSPRRRSRSPRRRSPSPHRQRRRRSSSGS